MKRPRITTDDWLAELNRVSQVCDADGLTTDEIAQHLGCSMSTAAKRIKRAGWRLVGTKPVKGMNGVVQPVAAYAPAQKAKTK